MHSDGLGHLVIVFTIITDTFEFKSTIFTISICLYVYFISWQLSMDCFYSTFAPHLAFGYITLQYYYSDYSRDYSTDP